MFASDLIATEEKKRQRFIDGLNDHYRRYIVGNLMIDTYAKAVECAREHEQDYWAHKKSKDQTKIDTKTEQRNNGNMTKNSSGQHKNGKQRQTQYGNQQNNQTWKKQKGNGNDGNRKQGDTINTGAVVPVEPQPIPAEPIAFHGFCYNCRERGHKASDCPNEKVQEGGRRGQRPEQHNTMATNRNAQPRGPGQLYAIQPCEVEMQNATLGVVL
ncbi:zinc finger protein [Macleaya cordata]|uniref:Zinc finger protein n=1 Tax=Macleaya cordata TaxID=56857 RepID=A0A200Q570_MACCD|nr:zinc finger protein [Macleaya cordata]